MTRPLTMPPARPAVSSGCSTVDKPACNVKILPQVILFDMAKIQRTLNNPTVSSQFP
jgi:hypothetical protein